MAEIPARIVVSQINPSPPELSTPFPHEIAMAGRGVGSVGGGEGVGAGDGVGVLGGAVTGVAVGTRVGANVGGRVAAKVGAAVGRDAVAVGVAVRGVPLGPTGDGEAAVGGGSRLATLDRAIGVLGLLEIGAVEAGTIEGQAIDGAAAKLGSGVGWTMPTSATLASIPPSQVVATIATNGVRYRGTHGADSKRPPSMSGLDGRDERGWEPTNRERRPVAPRCLDAISRYYQR